MTTLYSYDLSVVPEFVNILLNQDSTNNELNIVEYYTPSIQKYKIVGYNKNFIDNETVKTIGLFRSVIINEKNSIVSVSPPKSLKIDTFFEKYPEKTSYIVGEQFIEGTMINLFWDPFVQSWEIATRNTVGGNVSFYKDNNGKTFHQMFYEACNYENLDIHLLDKQYCYSFVLQHPDNRIVVPFNRPQLYLIEVYKIENTVVHVQCLSDIRIFGFENTTIQLPQIYDYNHHQDLINTYASNNTPYDTLGIVFKNILTGERTKKRNPVYEEIKHLKGNHPKLQYRYLCLRKEAKVNEYLQHFPEHKKECAKYRQQLHDFTNTLFSNYRECYIKKYKQLIDYPPPYRHHMVAIHNIYRNELFDKKLFVTNNVVIEYVNKLHPSQQMYSLNYNIRKRILDFFNQTETE
jgi:hypothetical protein